jgi:hypothetical protein
MACRITSTERHARLSGATLVENLVGMAVGVLVLLALCCFSLFNARSFAGFSSYTTFDLANRKATDQMTRDLRMVKSVTAFSSNAVTLTDFDGRPLQYSYSPASQTLTRIKGTTNLVLLRDCTRLSFAMNTRNLASGTMGFSPTTNIFECKALTVSWCCARKILGQSQDDMPQKETVVIRN